jgi:plasmid maintenance system antidote protein VapI
MPKRRTRATTLTELLRQALAEAESLAGIERAIGLKRQSLGRFLHRRQSLRLDLADRLAAYFGIESRSSRRGSHP